MSAHAPVFTDATLRCRRENALSWASDFEDGALCPSKSGLMNKHIVKHIVRIAQESGNGSRTIARAFTSLHFTAWYDMLHNMSLYASQYVSFWYSVQFGTIHFY